MPGEGGAVMTEFIDHALAYVAAGLPVLPLRERGKEPATRHGKDDATLDPEQVRDWWIRHPRPGNRSSLARWSR